MRGDLPESSTGKALPTTDSFSCHALMRVSERESETMKPISKFTFALGCMIVALLCATSALAQKKKANPYACNQPQAENLCTAANTCGSASTPCVVSIRKSGSGASIAPTTAEGKSNQLFCVKAGTTINFETKSKNTGFVVDFGPQSPFDKEDSIVGGSKKPDSAVAKSPGCYRFSAGACVSGAVDGMCGTQMAEMVITK